MNATERPPQIRNVLLVEDDPAWAELTREAFTEVAPGVAVEVVSNGERALARLRSGAVPDLVLLDLNLPGLDGRDVLRAARRDPALRTDIIVLSASAAEKDLALAVELGARQFLTKPTSFVALRALVGTLVGRPAPQLRADGSPPQGRIVSPGRGDGEQFGQHVALIDDSPLDSELVRDQLKPLDVVVRTTGSIAGFHQEGLANWADCVLLDLQLPDSDRLEGLRSVRQAAPWLPIVVLTGRDNEALALAALGNGAQDWVIKGSVGPAGLARSVRLAVERKRLEEELVNEREFLNTVLNQVEAGIVVCDADGRLTYFNRAAQDLHGAGADPGVAPAGWAGHYHCRDAQSQQPMAADDHPLHRALRGETVRDAEMTLTPPDRPRRDLVASAQPLWGPDSRLIGAVAVLHDVTERREAEATFKHLALHDALTGLPNRALLFDRLGAAIVRARRAGKRVGVLFIDLDHFKSINDTHGHDAGDLALRRVSRRIEDALRADDTVGRLAGDEFLAICENLEDRADADVLAQRVVDAMARPINVEGLELGLTASVGVVVADGDADARTILRDADTAMYEAKRRGRSRIHSFSEGLAAAAMAWGRTRAELRVALREGQLFLDYQPVYNLLTGEMVALEALLRWEHPSRGRLEPADFLQVAEDTDLIGPVSEWALREAAEAFLRHALPIGADGQAPVLAVNLSARQLSRHDLRGHVRSVLEAAGLPAAQLCLELTETAMMTAADSATSELRALRDMGVRLAIDDFGTGFASLSYLRKYPVDILKIDRSFTAGLPGSAPDAAIVEAVIGLGRRLGLQVIAEGIETPAQLRALRDAGCPVGQGFLLGRPGPLSWLSRNAPGVGDAHRLVDGLAVDPVRPDVQLDEVVPGE